MPSCGLAFTGSAETVGELLAVVGKDLGTLKGAYWMRSSIKHRAVLADFDVVTLRENPAGVKPFGFRIRPNRKGRIILGGFWEFPGPGAILSGKRITFLIVPEHWDRYFPWGFR